MAKERFHFFWGGPLSNWYPAKFVLGGIEYNCVEQHMMAHKAMMFGDPAALMAIMHAVHPREQKAWGRKVIGFQVEKWEATAREIVYRGCMAKFQQNPEVFDDLKSTAGTTLVEASPHDRIWGIGLGAEDPRSQDRDMWLGRNWLGEVLTRVRDDLMRTEQN